MNLSGKFVGINIHRVSSVSMGKITCALGCEKMRTFWVRNIEFKTDENTVTITLFGKTEQDLMTADEMVKLAEQMEEDAYHDSCELAKMPDPKVA